ncbi:MAG: group 1 glycosyl transferase [Parcubacteria group bacterium LiPW_30]|nr:MAG: group 1 glycosyl transferase [Parcubacteria group bacterium LiPW_30]
MKPKLCYVLPRYETKDASHFSHIHDFLSKIGVIFDIYLIVEKGSKPPISVGYTKAYLIKSKFIFFRIIETKIILLRARLSGYKDFYIHYSFFSAFFSSIIVRVFGGRVFYWNCGEPWKYKRNVFREIFERLVYKMVTHLVTGAPLLADEYVKHYGIKRDSVLVMPNWIDLERFKNTLSREDARAKLNISQESKVVLFVHHLSRRKGSRIILPVAKKVIDSFPDTIFIVVGSGPDENFLRDEVVRLGLNKNIRLVGAVANRELPDYFIASDVFFMPSEEEGFPRVLLESMAMGVPFVASDVGAVRDIIPGSMMENVIPLNNVDSFADRICLFLNQDSITRGLVAEKLKTHVVNYDVSSVSEIFVKLLKN